MCGIIFGSRKDKHPIFLPVKKRLDKQIHRGKEGFGYIAIQDGKIKSIERAEKEDEIVEKLNNEIASEILLHHRLPTSTENHVDATHPIVVKNKLLKHDYYVVHNGVLKNYLSLKEEYDRMGFEFTTLIEKIYITKTKNSESQHSIIKFNDSEALAIDLALYLDGYKDTIDSKGSIAFIAIQANKRGAVQKIFFGRNTGNPLVYEKNGDLFFLRSEGGGEGIEANILYTLDYKTKEITKKKVRIGELYEVSRYGNGIGFGGYSCGGATMNTSRLPAPHKEVDHDPYEHDYNAEYEDSYRFTLQHLEDVENELSYVSQELETVREELKKHYKKMVPLEQMDLQYYKGYHTEMKSKKRELEQERDFVQEKMEKNNDAIIQSLEEREDDNEDIQQELFRGGKKKPKKKKRKKGRKKRRR